MLILYEKPVALHPERHRNLRLQQQEPRFDFARRANSVPLAGVEFPQAAGHYPIVFAGEDLDQVFPAVLLGLRDAQNLYVDTDGLWGAEYIPAFVRRYPFVLAKPEADSEQTDYTVCIDEAFLGLSEDDTGEALFDESGEPAAFLQRAMEFLSDYQQHLETTRAFVERLRELDLLVPRHINVQTADGEELSLGGLYLIDEQRYSQLKDDEVTELFRSGYLGWIQAHLISLHRLQSLSNKLTATVAEEPDLSP